MIQIMVMKMRRTKMKTKQSQEQFEEEKFQLGKKLLKSKLKTTFSIFKEFVERQLTVKNKITEDMYVSLYRDFCIEVGIHGIEKTMEEFIDWSFEKWSEDTHGTELWIKGVTALVDQLSKLNGGPSSIIAINKNEVFLVAAKHKITFYTGMKIPRLTQALNNEMKYWNNRGFNYKLIQ